MTWSSYTEQSLYLQLAMVLNVVLFIHGFDCALACVWCRPYTWHQTCMYNSYMKSSWILFVHGINLVLACAWYLVYVHNIYCIYLASVFLYGIKFVFICRCHWFYTYLHMTSSFYQWDGFYTTCGRWWYIEYRWRTWCMEAFRAATTMPKWVLMCTLCSLFQIHCLLTIPRLLTWMTEIWFLCKPCKIKTQPR